MGQLRPPHHRQRAHLFDRRRASGRTARHGRDAHRGPSLHHDRAQPRRAPRRRRPVRSFRRVRSAEPGDVPLRPARDQSALRHDRAAGQCRRAGAAARRHGGSRRPPRSAVALCDARAGARDPAARLPRREIRPRFDLGSPSRGRAVAHHGADPGDPRFGGDAAAPGPAMGHRHAHSLECHGRIRRAPRVRRFADVRRQDGPQGRQHRDPVHEKIEKGSST